MPNIIALHRSLLWPRLAVGLADFGALCFAASVAFAGEVRAEETRQVAVVDVMET